MDDGFMTGYVAGQNEGNNGGMFGGGGWDAWIVIILFALIFGWGNNGWGGNGGNGSMSFLPYAIGANGALTRGDLCSEFSFNDLQNGVRSVATDVATGFANLNSTICHQQYDTAMLVNGVSNTVQQGFNASNIVALQNQNALQTQLAQCCCENREGQAQIRYDMATNTCALQNTMNTNTRDIIDSQNAGTRAILDYLCQEKISDLQSENQALRLSASQSAQNQYLISQLRPYPVASYTVPNPFTGAYGYQGYGYGNYGCCGCAS